MHISELLEVVLKKVFYVVFFFLFLSHSPGIKLYEGEKYVITEEKLNVFTWQLNLTVKNLQKSDFGAYLCSSINALGKADARIRLNGRLRMFAQIICTACI